MNMNRKLFIRLRINDKIVNSWDDIELKNAIPLIVKELMENPISSRDSRKIQITMTNDYPDDANDSDDEKILTIDDLFQAQEKVLNLNNSQE